MFQKKSGMGKFFWIRKEDGVSRLSFKIFFVSVPKNFVGNNSVFSKFFDTKKVYE